MLDVLYAKLPSSLENVRKRKKKTDRTRKPGEKSRTPKVEIVLTKEKLKLKGQIKGR